MTNLFDKYVRTAQAPAQDSIRAHVWGREAEPTAALLEQYKLYVEMADRISSRRALTNTFFLAVNTAAFTVVGVFWERPPSAGEAWALFPWAALMIQCLTWFWLLRSYRQLNTAKYAVIGILEERLPASPYWSGEWAALGEGKDPARYWPMSHIEVWVPALFAAVYTGGLIALIVFH